AAVRAADDVGTAAEGDVGRVADETTVGVGGIVEGEGGGPGDRGVVAERDHAGGGVDGGDRRVGGHAAAADAHADHQVGAVGDGHRVAAGGATAAGLADRKIALQHQVGVVDADRTGDVDGGVHPGARLL